MTFSLLFRFILLCANPILCSETFLRTSVSPEQAERIAIVLACPDEGRDVWALVTEDNMVEYGWISTQMELDPDQPRGQKPAPKKAKAKVGLPCSRRLMPLGH